MSVPITKALQNFFVFQRSRCNDLSNFKLEILMCFNSPIIKHWTPLHQTSHIFPVSWPNGACFVMFECKVESYKFFKTLKVEEQGARIQPFLNFKVFWHPPASLNQINEKRLEKCKWEKKTKKRKRLLQ
jgi:hypothetical protein